jgi:hypothetical protein
VKIRTTRKMVRFALSTDYHAANHVAVTVTADRDCSRVSMTAPPDGAPRRELHERAMHTRSRADRLTDNSPLVVFSRSSLLDRVSLRGSIGIVMSL